jgi:hypothetical protein
MSEPLLLLKEHLTNCYELLEKNNKKLNDFIQTVTEKLTRLEEEKLSSLEFRRFLDEFGKTLQEGLPQLGEKVTKETRSSPAEEKCLRDVGGSEEITSAVPCQATDEALQTMEFAEAQMEPQQEGTPENIGFDLKTSGDVLKVGNGVISVIGDAEIPAETSVGTALIVKGNFKTGQNCRLLKSVKASGDLIIGAGTITEGNLVSGGKTALGVSCIVHGSIDADGDIEIDENAVVECALRSKSSIVMKQSAKVLQAVFAAKGLSMLKAM